MNLDGDIIQNLDSSEKQKSNLVVFTYLSLDGLVSYLILCWLYKKNLDIIPTSQTKLVEDFLKWQNKNPENKDSFLFFLDLDTSTLGPFIDYSNVFIFDHHCSNVYPFRHAISCVKKYSSCSKLLYDIFKSKLSHCNVMQKILIALADDWDSGQKAIQLSQDLNIVMHNTQNKVVSFIETYKNGFVPFTRQQKNIIALYKKNCNEHIKTIKSFIGHLNIENQTHSIVSAITDKYPEEVCDYLLNTTNTDIAVVIMIEHNRVVFRRNKKATVNLAHLAQSLVNGGGYDYAAGGEITEQFLELTKQFKPIEENKNL